MRGAVDLQLSSQAVEQLSELGRVARRLLPVVIRDQLVASARGRGLRQISEANLVEALEGTEVGFSPLEQDTSRWYALPILDDYVAIVRPDVDDGEVKGALVASIVKTSTIEESAPSPAVESGPRASHRPTA